jgi:pilus assembly protein CpaC
MRPKLFRKHVGMVAVAGLAALMVTALATAQPPATPAARGSGPDETLTIGETIYIWARSGLRIKEAATSRDGIVELRPVQNKPHVLQVVGIGVGSTRITLTDEKDQVTTLVVAVEPDLQFIRSAVAKQFPRANLEITQGPDRTLIVGGTVESAEDIEPLMRFLEGYAGTGRVANNLRITGPNQVQLEVIVAKVDRTELRRFGFNFLWSDRADYFGSTIGSLINPQTINLRGGVSTFATDRPIFDAATNFLYGVTDASSAFLGFVEALRREGLAKILSSPVIVARSGRPARITVGGEQPYPTPAALGQAPGVEFRRFGTIVQFLPVVLGDGRIRIQVRAEVSRLDFSQPVLISGTVVPRFLTQEAEAAVDLESGQSLVLGGLIQSEVDAATNKVPVLGDLPFVGTAFRRVQYEEREQELIILVTPRLVDGLWPHQRPTCFPGQETRRPTDFELFLEGILEAPPGPRSLKPDGCYRPAHWHFTPGLAEAEMSSPAEPVLPPPQPMSSEKNRPTGTLPLKTSPEQPRTKGSQAPAVQQLPESPPPVNKPPQTDTRPVEPSVSSFPTMTATGTEQEPRERSSPPPAVAETVVVEPTVTGPPRATLGRPTPRPLYRPLRED